MIPLHYMRWWLSTSIDFQRRQGHSRAAGPAHLTSAAAATHLALAGSAGCVLLLLAVCHQAIGALVCSRQACVAAPGAKAASALWQAARRAPAQPGLLPLMTNGRRRRRVCMHCYSGEAESKATSAHAGSQARVSSMGGLYDAATLHALVAIYLQ